MVFTDLTFFQGKEKIMRRKESLYAAIGGVAGAVLTLAVCSVMPIGAQNGNATFGEITCTALKVVDAEGFPGVKLFAGENSGVVVVDGKGGYVALEGGDVSVNGTGGGSVQLTSHGVLVYGTVRVEGEAGGVWLSSGEHGGLVRVVNKDDAGEARLGINEHGGNVAVYGKGSNKSRAIITVNEYGNGVVSTWDKNDYRLATLK